MAKPTGADMRWATGGSADLAEPSSGLRDTGFVGGTQVDEAFVNKLLKNAYLWQQYLNGLEAETFTWTGVHTFVAQLVAGNGNYVGTPPVAVNITGNSKVGTGNGAAALNIAGGAAGAGGGDGGAAIIAAGGTPVGGGAKSNAIQATAGAGGSALVAVGGTTGRGVEAYSGSAGGYAGSFTTNASGKAARFDDASSNGRSIVEVAGFINLADAYVSPNTDGQGLVLAPGNTVRARLTFVCNGTNSPTIKSGFNMTVFHDPTGVFLFTFVTALANANYSIVFQCESSPIYGGEVHSKATGGVQEVPQNIASGAYPDRTALSAGSGQTFTCIISGA